MKKILPLLILFTPLVLFSQFTAIPDANFEQALIDLGHDTGTPDGQVLTANISGIVTLDVQQYGIYQLFGIEDFSALEVLSCGLNPLGNLALTQNTALTYLNCWGSQLTSLDVTQNTALTELNCNQNELTNLDLTQNTALTYLNCWYNQLTSIDVSQNIALTDLICHENLLTSLNVSQNIALIVLTSS